MKTPTNPENVEKVRQATMRYRELLDIMRLRLEEGERRYDGLFANITLEERQGKSHKDVQTLLARQLVDDVEPLSRAVLQAHFDARELQREFSELSDIILTPLPED